MLVETVLTFLGFQLTILPCLHRSHDRLGSVGVKQVVVQILGWMLKYTVSGGCTALLTTWGLGLEVFGHWLQPMCYTYLLSSEYFNNQTGLGLDNIWVWVWNRSSGNLGSCVEVTLVGAIVVHRHVFCWGGCFENWPVKLCICFQEETLGDKTRLPNVFDLEFLPVVWV